MMDWLAVTLGTLAGTAFAWWRAGRETERQRIEREAEWMASMIQISQAHLEAIQRRYQSRPEDPL